MAMAAFCGMPHSESEVYYVLNPDSNGSRLRRMLIHELASCARTRLRIIRNVNAV